MATDITGAAFGAAAPMQNGCRNYLAVMEKSKDSFQNSMIVLLIKCWLLNSCSGFNKMMIWWRYDLFSTLKVPLFCAIFYMVQEKLFISKECNLFSMCNILLIYSLLQKEKKGGGRNKIEKIMIKKMENNVILYTR